jgi:Protein of unknown function (DUF1176)
MHRGYLAFISGLTAFGALAAAPPVSVGTLQTFKDWTVGCDNGLACQAVALMPEGSVGDGLSLIITRSAGVASPLAIELSGFTSKAERYRVVVDGRVAQSGAMAAGAETIKVGGPSALKLGRAMAKGKALRVIDGSGNDLGSASLSGVSAALRYIDAQQGRAGSRSAVVATGRKAPTAKKAELPVITVKKIAPTDALPDTPALVALSENSPCAADRFGSTEDTAYSLGEGASGAQALVLLNCGAGAYNFSTGVYVGQRSGTGKWSFEPAKFDYGATGFSDDSKIPILVNADWDAATQTVSSYAKGRGLGDCGSSESWVWDGAMFRLTSAVAMGECRGSTDWIPVWRAEVRLTP